MIPPHFDPCPVTPTPDGSALPASDHRRLEVEVTAARIAPTEHARACWLIGVEQVAALAHLRHEITS